MIIEFKGMRPDVEKATFIADSATLSGDIHLAENTSVWLAPLFDASVPVLTVFSACIVAFCACSEISVCAFGNIGYNSISRPSGGMADAAVSKTVVERRASSTLASGTILNLKADF